MAYMSRLEYSELVKNAQKEWVDVWEMTKELIEKRGYEIEWFKEFKRWLVESSVHDDMKIKQEWSKKVSWWMKNIALWMVGGSVVWEALKFVGKTLYWATLPSSAQEAGAQQAYLAWVTDVKPRKVVDTAIQSPLLQKWPILRQPSSVIWQMGTLSQIGVQARTKAKTIFKDFVEPVFEKAKDESFKFEDLKTKAISVIDKSEKYSTQRKRDLIEEVGGLFDDLWDTTGIRNLDKLKSEIARKLPKKYFNGQPVTNDLTEAQGIVSSIFREAVHDTIKKYGVDGAKKYRDYANLQELAKKGQKSMTQSGRMWGAGSALSWVYEELATPILTTTGKLTYKTGEVLQAIPKVTYNLLRKAPRVVKWLIKNGTLPGIMTQIFIPEWLPGDIAEKSMQAHIDYQTDKSKFKKLSGWLYEAVSINDYEKYKDQDGSLTFPDGSKYDAEGRFVWQLY